MIHTNSNRAKNDDDKKVCIVILNFKTYDLTLNLINHLRNIGFREDIIVVDNNSNNGSYETLSIERNAIDFMLIKNNLNTGYAAGNNIGIIKAIELGYQSILICNNDIEIDDVASIYNMYELIYGNATIGCVSPRMYDFAGNEITQRIFRPNVWSYTLGIFAEECKMHRLTREKKENFEIYRPQGSCMLLSANMLRHVGTLDERTFLYFEEEILAEKMLQNDYKCFCCVSAHVVHNHSVTIQRFVTKFHKTKIYLHSLQIYMKDYRHWNVISRILCSLVKGLTMVMK